MSDQTPPPLASWREIIVGLFPWLAKIGLSASGALAIRSAAGRTELEGGGAKVARAADVCGYEYVQIVSGAVVAVYRSDLSGPGSAWTLVASGALPPVDNVTHGTAIKITTGSGKVSCG